jgi:hypothetical protein
MKLFKFTQVEKKYYDYEIEAETAEEAREIFNNTMDIKIDWENPDYLDGEYYFEEIKE